MTSIAALTRPARIGAAAGHSVIFWGSAIVGCLALLAALRVIGNDYAYFAGYVVLQYIVLATGWNVLGGYAGYVNFGAAAFFATGVYTTIVLKHALGLGLLPSIAAAGIAGGALGIATGYLTLRLRGVYFSIATLCLAVVLETIIVNWRYVGGSRGVYMMRPATTAPFASYAEYLFVVMLVLVLIAVGVARGIERSRLGVGLAALRDDERAAEATGVPTLRLKLIATGVSGALMGMAGAPLPYYISFTNPEAAFALSTTVNAMAMPLIGGTEMWLGPVIGAVLLASLQQAATVMISSAANLLIVGFVLVGFVIAAPNGLIGLVLARRRSRT
jgi:branched-chain amino acid transport system permease protein